MHFWRFAGWVWVVHWLHLGLGWHTRFAFGASEVGWVGGTSTFHLDLVGGFPLYLRFLPSFISISIKAFHSTLHTLPVFVVGTTTRRLNCICLSVQHFHKQIPHSLSRFVLSSLLYRSFFPAACISLPSSSRIQLFIEAMQPVHIPLRLRAHSP